MANKKGKLIVISGPSGVGKGTVLKEFLKTAKNTFLSVSATTRKPRKGEINGENYFYVSKEQFEEMLKNGEIIEHTVYNGNYYGTPCTPVQKAIDDGKNVILEIEVDGCMQVKKVFEDALTIFIMPPSFDELIERLTGRHTETPEQIQGRLNRAKEEIAFKENYDVVLINDTVENAAKELGKIINTI